MDSHIPQRGTAPVNLQGRNRIPIANLFQNLYRNLFDIPLTQQSAELGLFPRLLLICLLQTFFSEISTTQI